MKDITIHAIIRNPSSKSSFQIRWTDLNCFVSIPWLVPAYRKSDNNKVFPIYLQELSDLNPDNSGWKKYFPGSHPFFRHVSFLQYYIAWKNNKPSGRIAAFINDTYHENGTKGPIGWIGLFECIECEKTAYILLKTAITSLKNQGTEKIIGPARFNANGEVGLLIKGFEYHPMYMEPYHPPYYQKYFEQMGQKENDWFAFQINASSIKPLIQRIRSIEEKHQRLHKKLNKDVILFRSINYKKFFQDAEAIRQLYNQAWNTETHPQFEKMSKDEFRYIAQGLKTMAQKEWVLLAENQNGPSSKLIAFSVMVPDINELIRVHDSHRKLSTIYSYKIGLIQWLFRDITIIMQLKKWLRYRKFTKARIFILGSLIKKRGLDALLYSKSFELANQFGIRWGSGSQIADINLEMINPLKRMGEITFVWRVYRFDI